MKATTLIYRPKANFACSKATLKRVAHKLLDILIITASDMGIAAMLLLIAVL